MSKDEVYANACRLRDNAICEYEFAENDPYLQEDGFDPGDAEVDIEGQGHNVLTVLWILKHLGLEECEV